MNILAKNPQIRALSVAGPFPWLLSSGWKPIELRNWSTTYRGIVFFHASSGVGYEHLFAQFGLNRKDCPKYSIVGAAKLVDCICYDRASKWEADLERHRWVGNESYDEVLSQYGCCPYGHVFEDAIAFDSPILDIPGAFNYWEPKNDRQKRGFEKAIALLELIA